MKDNLVRDLMKRYISYFDLITMTDPEVKKQIFKWIDRDIAWLMEQSKNLEPRFKPNKTIVAWSGQAYMLSKILAAGDKIK